MCLYKICKCWWRSHFCLLLLLPLPLCRWSSFTKFIPYTLISIAVTMLYTLRWVFFFHLLCFHRCSFQASAVSVPFVVGFKFFFITIFILLLSMYLMCPIQFIQFIQFGAYDESVIITCAHFKNSIKIADIL